MCSGKTESGGAQDGVSKLCKTTKRDAQPELLTLPKLLRDYTSHANVLAVQISVPSPFVGVAILLELDAVNSIKEIASVDVGDVLLDAGVRGVLHRGHLHRHGGRHAR